jgi:hypothetical protein
MIPTGAEMVELASRIWGTPNAALSTPREARFGTNGSKCIKLSELVYYDHEANTGGGYRDLYKLATGRFPENGQSRSEFRPPAGMVRELGHPVAWWDYHDANGATIARVVRFEPPGADKTFRQCRPDGDGWKWATKGMEIPLYRLPDLLQASPGSDVYISEGEKHADLLRTWGLVATTNPGGARKFRDHHAKTLAGLGCRCIVLPDNDVAGLTHEQIVLKELHAAGCKDVRVIRLPNLPPKGDIIDWAAAGGTREQLDELLAGSEPATPAPAASHDEDEHKRRLNALALVEVMTTDPNWHGAIRLNRFTETIEVCEKFPPVSPRRCAYRAIREPADPLEAMLWFQAIPGFDQATKNMVWDAICAVAERNAYHPVRDYLDNLKWDGIPRLGRLFQHYFNAAVPADAGDEQDHAVAYLEHTSKCWSISAVARIYEPGCKVDHTPVALGPQNLNKSKAVAALCPDEAWFSDDLSTDLGARDTKDSLRGKWLMELAELPHIRKEVRQVKQFFSKQTDRYRRPYDRSTQDWARQCVFFASANELEFLDPTGNRRWWPFEPTKAIDVERIKADRDQLWAEAVALYRDGYQWWLPATIERLANEQQEQYREDDVWCGILATWIEEKQKLLPEGEPPEPFTLTDAMECLGFHDPRAIDKRAQMRASDALKSLGYSSKLGRHNGSAPAKLWRPRTAR